MEKQAEVNHSVSYLQQIFIQRKIEDMEAHRATVAIPNLKSNDSKLNSFSGVHPLDNVRTPSGLSKHKSMSVT